MTRTLNLICDAAMALVYPAACAACGAALVEARADFPACARCWSETRVFTERDALCGKCGAPAPTDVGGEWAETLRCGRCDAEDFTAARACGVYGGALRAAVLSLKREPHVGRRLARLLADACARPPLDRATRVLPVPLHPAREGERGFNQASILARAVS
ncbi:MAG TPA: double zinc ribbon domain-containing protein, partial [Pyrinomonadaceae bacterium]|nr:double zinc ribbon domain-containing protein [Pyrinomonadaceae bacterium]